MYSYTTEWEQEFTWIRPGVANGDDRDKFPVGRSDVGATRAGVQSWQWVDYVLLPLSLGRLCLFVFLQTQPDVTRPCTRSVVFETWKVESAEGWN